MAGSGVRQRLPSCVEEDERAPTMADGPGDESWRGSCRNHQQVVACYGMAPTPADTPDS